MLPSSVCCRALKIPVLNTFLSMFTTMNFKFQYSAFDSYIATDLKFTTIVYMVVGNMNPYQRNYVFCFQRQVCYLKLSIPLPRLHEEMCAGAWMWTYSSSLIVNDKTALSNTWSKRKKGIYPGILWICEAVWGWNNVLLGGKSKHPKSPGLWKINIYFTLNLQSIAHGFINKMCHGYESLIDG